LLKKTGFVVLQIPSYTIPPTLFAVDGVVTVNIRFVKSSIKVPSVEMSGFESRDEVQRNDVQSMVQKPVSKKISSPLVLSMLFDCL